MNQTHLYQIALTMINGVGSILARQLLQAFGDAEAVFREKKQLLEKVPNIGPHLAAEIKKPDVIKRAENELAFTEKNLIDIRFLADKDYPHRLFEAPDAPMVIYTKGNIETNPPRSISIVGTRRMTNYGKDLTENFVKELAALCPDVMIISGLAYGIDIVAHRSALKNQLPTVAVLAHGLDRIYPAVHRNTAIEMLDNGGLLTDFPSGTNPDRQNFVSRNRIVAGLSDATIVIESAEKGGSLITADIASSYSRDVYAFPGRVNDPYSKGCNSLIRQNKAGLITSAEDFVKSMLWDAETKKRKEEEVPQLFDEEELDNPILNLLKERGELHINTLSVELNIPIYKLSSMLFDLEMSGYIQALPGSVYRRRLR